MDIVIRLKEDAQWGTSVTDTVLNANQNRDVDTLTKNSVNSPPDQPCETSSIEAGRVRDSYLTPRSLTPEAWLSPYQGIPSSGASEQDADTPVSEVFVATDIAPIPPSPSLAAWIVTAVPHTQGYDCRVEPFLFAQDQIRQQVQQHEAVSKSVAEQLHQFNPLQRARILEHVRDQSLELNSVGELCRQQVPSVLGDVEVSVLPRTTRLPDLMVPANVIMRSNNPLPQALDAGGWMDLDHSMAPSSHKDAVEVPMWSGSKDTWASTDGSHFQPLCARTGREQECADEKEVQCGPESGLGAMQSNNDRPAPAAVLSIRRKAPPPSSNIITATALYDFEPAEHDGEELAFRQGETIEIVERSRALEEDGWCRARIKDRRKVGLVLLDFVKEVKSSRREHSQRKHTHARAKSRESTRKPASPLRQHDSHSRGQLSKDSTVDEFIAAWTTAYD